MGQIVIEEEQPQAPTDTMQAAPTSTPTEPAWFSPEMYQDYFVKAEQFSLVVFRYSAPLLSLVLLVLGFGHLVAGDMWPGLGCILVARFLRY